MIQQEPMFEQKRVLKQKRVSEQERVFEHETTIQHEAKIMRRQGGFSLLELMAAVAIVAILAAVALPAYNDYIDTGSEGALVSSMATIEVFQENFRLRTGAYAVDLANVAAITAAIDWDPRDGNTYAIADGDGTTYSLTGTTVAGDSVCMVFPAKTRC